MDFLNIFNKGELGPQSHEPAARKLYSGHPRSHHELHHSQSFPAGPIREHWERRFPALFILPAGHMPLKELIHPLSNNYHNGPRVSQRRHYFPGSKKQHLRPASILNAYV